ncbi:cysteine proteinase [Choiromyces venosus 120613-1]|uniref:Ubiquitin carboxyl-terminal hydrolase n=1 Tax=Choiromyces venosus 120613-1 TaxID=1336337 RepID=A0A3N4J952_9PEZI|nr:cysteine proteinase [Choiromyces venosus 120613-1]
MLPSSGDKQLTLAYAVGASLAAVTLVYVFGPTWLIDSSNSSSSQRRKGVVGLVNTANDCFINSILQALAGLGELRAYLVQQTINAKANGELIGDGLTADRKPFLTKALKDILDGLNERPIHKKTISARPFLTVLEGVFQQQISRSQQDAHEFLQVVVETLAEEYHRQKRRSQEAMKLRIENERLLQSADEEFEEDEDVGSEKPQESDGLVIRVEDLGKKEEDKRESEEGGMPMEGKLESEIECLKCHFKPKPSVSTFVVLTLPVPQKTSATLSDCIDGVLSTEHIDDFTCARCRLQHALETYSRKLETASSPSDQVKKELTTTISKLQQAIDTDPERPPEDIELPSSRLAPKSRIARRTRMSYYPTIITFHLSRSIYDARSSSRKNSARVSFPEELKMGGLLERKGYKLLCMITHKGNHDSGHYECFRRQIVHRAPYSTPTPVPSSPPTPIPSSPKTGSTIRLVPAESMNESLTSSPETQTQGVPSSSSSLSSGSPSSSDPSSALDSKFTPPSSISTHHHYPNEDSSPTTLTTNSELSESPTSASPSSLPSPVPPPPAAQQSHKPSAPTKRLKKKRANDKWWRISDEKVREARTSDVLGMQKEVYLLFYQRNCEE